MWLALYWWDVVRNMKFYILKWFLFHAFTNDHLAEQACKVIFQSEGGSQNLKINNKKTPQKYILACHNLWFFICFYLVSCQVRCPLYYFTWKAHIHICMSEKWGWGPLLSQVCNGKKKMFCYPNPEFKSGNPESLGHCSTNWHIWSLMQDSAVMCSFSTFCAHHSWKMYPKPVVNLGKITNTFNTSRLQKYAAKRREHF